MYTLKSIVQRGALLGAAGALVVATFAPSAVVLANSLTPLTERSLLLSSSAPGYVNTDGSGYTSQSGSNPNPGGDGVVGDTGTSVPYSYAPAGSGPNGMKTGEKFTFTVSTTDTVQGFSFQYCTTAAGLCKAPGNNTGDARTTPTPDRETNAVAHPLNRSDLDIVGTFDQAAAATAPTAGQFQISVEGTETSVTDWEMVAVNAEDNAWIDGGTPSSDGLTGKNNYLILYSPTGVSLTAGQEVTVEFKASESIYITNPGEGSFFVKINTYDTDDYDNTDTTGGYTNTTPLDSNNNIVDGGVTVANVMTDSIHIVTKVLETMSFSVGIQNPDTVDEVGNSSHGTCDAISQTSTLTGLTNNRLNLGDPNAEYSLATNKAYDTHSYWRLSSNSSGGATVYYSGATLSNTSGDQIADMPVTAASRPGTEQFGLGFVDAGVDTMANAIPEYLDPPTNEDPNPAYVDGGDTFQSGWTTPSSYPFKTLSTQTIGAGDFADLSAAQTAADDYSLATGTIDDGAGGVGTAQFKFLGSSLTTPEVIAQQNETVISCATAKMRYVANIGADTPAGVYTTKVNYLAAPQY